MGQPPFFSRLISLPPTIIYRHRKENVKKCSLSPLERRSDFLFFTYPQESLPALEKVILLDLNAPILSFADRNHSLLIIDATWKLAKKMILQIDTSSLLIRSLPPTLKTAYPRRQTDCPDPLRGLASIEAIYSAYTLFKRDTNGLLDHYYWKEAFLTQNEFFHNLDSDNKHYKEK